jgi:hypothetical protein
MLIVAAALGAARRQEPAAPATPAVWPRTFEKGGDKIVMYQPQVDSWKDQAQIAFRCALAISPQSGGQANVGVVAITGATAVDDITRTVEITNLTCDPQFPGLSPAESQPLIQLVKSLLPASGAIHASLDEVLACLHDVSKIPRVALNVEPPPIYTSDSPAILVIYMGAPQFQPVPGARLMFAVNTNWVVLMDPTAGQYYLLVGDSWLTAPDPLAGPWFAAGTTLPADFSKLPSADHWDSVKEHVPGSPFAVVPNVITSKVPAELIVTNGPPSYTPIAGTRLMYVSNPTTPLFLDLADFNYYFLVAGRWFRAPKPAGPWAAASAELPAEFAKIPPASPVGFVLSAVPHTQEADDAVLLASVAHKATITTDKTTVEVTYQGAPKFVEIPGTSMTYAVNTPYEVVFAGGQYYCCHQAVWFTAPAPTGPWTVCAQVPAVIYTIPPTCPIYNVTYVRVYGSTPTTVIVGYTGGYCGEYVATTGALMFGAGMALGVAIANNNDWCCYPPCYYSYGLACHYSYGWGCYYRSGCAWYGPHGGCGWGACYNPATGTYARGGFAYGPDGAHWGAQAYNPWTNTYSQHSGGANGYSSWGKSYVQQGNQWAKAGHQSGALGATGWAENSAGQSVAAAKGIGGNAVAKTGNGDLYSGHDGNVYRNTNGSWEKYQGGGSWGSAAAGGAIANNRGGNNAGGGLGGGDLGGNNSGLGNSSGALSGLGNWNQQNTQASLNQDLWSRNQGATNGAQSWGSRFGNGSLGGGSGLGSGGGLLGGVNSGGGGLGSELNSGGGGGLGSELGGGLNSGVANSGGGFGGGLGGGGFGGWGARRGGFGGFGGFRR